MTPPPKDQVARWITCPTCRRRVGVRRNREVIFRHRGPTTRWAEAFNCPSSGQPAPPVDVYYERRHEDGDWGAPEPLEKPHG